MSQIYSIEFNCPVSKGPATLLVEITTEQGGDGQKITRATAVCTECYMNITGGALLAGTVKPDQSGTVLRGVCETPGTQDTKEFAIFARL